MAVDFSKYLSKKVEEIERPSVGPVGHYFAKLQSWKGAERFYEGKGGPATPVVEVTFKITGVDEDALEEDAASAEKGIGRLVTRDYNLSDEGGTYALRRLTEETCGVDTAGLDLSDALDACKGSDVKVFNEPRQGKEEGQLFWNIKQVLPA